MNTFLRMLGSVHQILDAHFHYVQGVAWDPLGKYAASFSSDRTCRIYINKPSKAKGVERSNYVCQHVISKSESTVADESKVSTILLNTVLLYLQRQKLLVNLIYLGCDSVS